MIRPAQFEDAAAIASIHVRGWQTAYAGFLPAAYLDALSIEQRTTQWERILRLQRPGATFVFVADEVVRGWIDWGHARDSAGAEAAEIFALYIDPPHRGRGIGKQLMRHAEQSIAAHRRLEIVLWVLEQNTAACGFYERTGFTRDGARKTEVIGGVDAVEVRYRKSTDTIRVVMPPPPTA